MTQRSALIGNAEAMIATVIFGASVVATRAVVDEVDPLGLAVLRFGLGGIVLAVALLAVRRPALRLDRHALRTIVLLGALLYAVFPLLFNSSLRLTTASRGAVLLATAPLWSALFARLAGHERLRQRQLTGVLLSTVGVGLALAGGGEVHGRDLAGGGLMLAAALGAAVYSVLAKPVVGRYPPVAVTTYGMLGGATLLLPVALVAGLPGAIGEIDRDAALLVAYLAVGGGALAYWLITEALARLSPTQAVAYLNVNPLVAIALSTILLDEPLTLRFTLGFVLVASGVVLVNWPVTSSAPRPRADPPQIAPISERSPAIGE